MQIEATVVAALPLEQGVSKSTGNPWSKATIIVETTGQYPKKVALSNMKKAEEFIALPIGSVFTFDIDVESREYNGKWFTNCSCFRWNPLGAQTLTQAPQPLSQTPQPPYAHQAPQQGNLYQRPQQYQQPFAQQPQGDDSIPF